MVGKTGNSRNRLTPTETRAARRARRSKRKRLLRWAGLSLIGLIALAFIIALFLPGLPISTGSSGLPGSKAPDGPGQRIEDAGGGHIKRDQSPTPYLSKPATSGQHYSDSGAPTTWGVHDIFVQDEVLVHNLEHGGIAIHYDCSEPCPEIVNQLADITNRAVREGLKVLLSPYPGMSNRIMLTAWTFMDGFDVYDEQRIVDFIQSHESSPNAPESFAR